MGWLLTHGSGRKALGLILTAAAILLFLLNLRRWEVLAAASKHEIRRLEVQNTSQPQDRFGCGIPVGVDPDERVVTCRSRQIEVLE